MIDYRRHARALVVAGLALPAFAGVGKRVLIGALAHRHALQGGRQTRAVHHREHAGEAAVFLADQPADGAALVAIGHDAGRRAVNADLVLKPGAAQVIPLAGRSIGVEQELRHEKQRNAARARGRVGQAREHEMDDVVRHVVIAVGDENLLAGDAIGSIGLTFGARAQAVEVRARRGFGQVHGRGPFAGHQLVDPRVPQFLRAMGDQRFHGAVGQCRTEHEGHVGRGPHLEAG